jgi:egghead protein (zeste-white 4 protein)
MAGSLRQFVVPKTYRTPEGSRFKARALTYLQTHTAPEPEDWHLYLDEESQIDSTLIAGLYRLVRQSYRQAERARLTTPRVVGQGGILYAGGSWFFRGADALRTADDIGRFRLQYALGMPLFGIHGSYIVVAGEDDPQLSFDVGPASSLTEDAAWALRTWARGYRFTWVEGYIYEQPPQRVMDFIRQRARWLSGIRLVLRDARVPMRYRASLAIFTALWQISFIPFVVTLAALVVHIAPPVWMRIPADFGWATFVLAYLQGAHVEARHAARAHIARAAASGKPLLWWQRVAVWVGLRLLAWLSSLCYIWYALLEAAGVLYSLLPKHDFFVIYKPSLAGSPSPSPHEAPKQPAPLARRPSA